MKIKIVPGKGCYVESTVAKYVSQKKAIPAPTFEETRNQELMDTEPPEPTQPVGDISTVRILLADDHQLMREALAKLLESHKGMTIVGTAKDGCEVIQLVAQLKPHVILMDVNMPVLDGFEATAQITRDHPDIRIIGLSLNNDAHTRQRMLDAGASAYLVKDDSPVTLVETICSVKYGNNPNVVKA